MFPEAFWKFRIKKFIDMLFQAIKGWHCMSKYSEIQIFTGKDGLRA